MLRSFELFAYATALLLLLLSLLLFSLCSYLTVVVFVVLLNLCPHISIDFKSLFSIIFTTVCRVSFNFTAINYCEEIDA